MSVSSPFNDFAPGVVNAAAAAARVSEYASKNIGMVFCVCVCRWTYSPLAAVILPFRHADSRQPPVSFCSIAAGAPGRPAGHRRSRQRRRRVVVGNTSQLGHGRQHTPQMHIFREEKKSGRNCKHVQRARRRSHTNSLLEKEKLPCPNTKRAHVRAYKNRTHSTLSRVLLPGA